MCPERSEQADGCSLSSAGNTGSWLRCRKIRLFVEPCVQRSTSAESRSFPHHQYLTSKNFLGGDVFKHHTFQALSTLAALLGLEDSALEKMLALRVVVTRGETFTKQFSVADAELTRDAIVKSLYEVRTHLTKSFFSKGEYIIWVVCPSRARLHCVALLLLCSACQSELCFTLFRGGAIGPTP